MSSSPDSPFELGRAEQRGGVLGLRAGQALSGATGAVALVAGIGSGSTAGLVVGIVALAVAIAVATVPVSGRGLDEWVPIAAAHLTRVRGGALCAGASVQPGGDALVPAHLRWPDGTATVVAALAHRGLRALGPEPRAFGESLAGWLRGLGSAGAPSWTVTILTTTGPGCSPRVAPWIDPGMHVTSCLAVTAAEPVRVAEVLAAAGVDGAADLGVEALDDLLAARVAPGYGTILGCDVAARWHLLEAPSTVHGAFFVEEWPMGSVDEQVLAPLCTSRDRRTVAISMRVEELRRARERTARVRTAAAADAQLIARGGFLASPESNRDSDQDATRANELAVGHGSMRLVGVIALDARDVVELEFAAARLLADAATCGVRLRRCEGDHRRGVLASVPGWCVP
jgi:hypothetical protein